MLVLVTGCEFEVPEDYANVPNSKVYARDGKYFIKVPSITTFTNLSVDRSASLNLTRRFDDSYKKYSNFDAINVDRVVDIPVDYDGLIGVPITYLSKHDSDKFTIVGIFNNFDATDLEAGRITGDLVKLDKPPWNTRGPCVDGNVPTYIRVIIKKK